ncbi:MAG: F0F1 ATP synthase subunit B [Actinomycetaceae bacterium]|nr:F0F1 ATP synthase subunit B [Actinomycetaceae bacterium]
MTTIFAAAEEQVGGLDVVLPPFYEIFWAAFALLLIALVGGRVLPKIFALLDERSRQIEEGLAAAEKAQEEASQAERERAETLREANVEAQAIREKAAEDARGIVNAARTEAQEEAARILETAQRQILAEKQAAEISLRTDVGLLATELAEKIVGEHLKDRELTSRVVDRFLDELESESVTRAGETSS